MNFNLNLGRFHFGSSEGFILDVLVVSVLVPVFINSLIGFFYSQFVPEVLAKLLLVAEHRNVFFLDEWSLFFTLNFLRGLLISFIDQCRNKLALELVLDVCLW